jgi:hypothetical protein
LLPRMQRKNQRRLRKRRRFNKLVLLEFKYNSLARECPLLKSQREN